MGDVVEYTYIRKLISKLRNISLDELIYSQKKSKNIEEVVTEVFNEPCIVYVDEMDDKTIAEIHFQDSNYYEIEISNIETKAKLIDRLTNNLIVERLIDKESIGVNRNNIRYFRSIKNEDRG